MKKNVTRGNGLLEGFLARQRSKMADSLLPTAIRSGSILDIGCGNHPYFLINTEFSVKHGLDRIQTDEIFEDATIKLTNFDLESGAPLPYGDESFEAISMLAVLEHLEPDTATGLVRESFRLLRRGGLFVATTPSWWTDRILKALAQLGLVSREEINEHKNMFSRSSLTEIVANSGFRKDHIRTGSFEMGMNLWISARKKS